MKNTHNWSCILLQIDQNKAKQTHTKCLTEEMMPCMQKILSTIAIFVQFLVVMRHSLIKNEGASL
jgi:hypothetical protein